MLRFLTAGESHGPCLTAVIEGLPSGLRLNPEQLDGEMARRQEGIGRGGRMKIERDRAEILSGVRFGETIGSPISLRIVNADWQNWQERMAVFGEPTGPAVVAPRPGHADLTGIEKYERDDVRDVLERASARETAARVAVGAVCRQFLQELAIEVKSEILSVGGETNPDRQLQKVEEARAAGDTLGGIFQVSATGLMAGLGSYIQWDRRLDGRIAAAILSIPAIKGIEFGVGFCCGELAGSQVHDEIFFEPGRGYYRKTNQAGGLEGGMTNGEPLVFRAAMKPIPTLTRPLASVDIRSHQSVQANAERSDVCAVHAAALVAEAMLCYVLAAAVLEKFGGDSMGQLLTAVDHYRRQAGRLR